MEDQILDEKAIFNAALALKSSAARQEYLRSACGADCELFQRVSKLLGLQAESPSFLEAPAAGILATLAMSPPTERVGKTIGRYKLRELLGEGGMGSVYVAEQSEPLRRKVALKIIKPGMDSQEVISRFESERQALALMDHPNIARVLDAGTTDSGLPYFVMELVKGMPITDHCDAQRLGTRDRLELFLQVCHAVQHAHQKGIIHRDIKPSNVLVAVHDVTPVVKVIDFGVAKAIGQQLTDNTLYTAVSQMVGTPLYMSPEQAGQSSLDIDTRSDVYSLGVVLYELFTGNTPFDKDTLKQAGFDEIRRIIREVDPPKPSARVSTLNAEAQSTVAGQRQLEPRKLCQQLRGELDWIVMKSIEKDRNRRYESANSLAKDVERYLNDAPVEACPPSTAYRLRKLYRRHKSAVVVTSVVLNALIAAAGASVTLAIRENQVVKRRLLVQRGINDVLTEVARLRGQVSTAELGSLTTLGQAREQIQRAQALTETGEADPHLVAQVQRLASEMDLERRDSQLLAALDSAWLAEPGLDWDRRFASEKGLPLLRDALSADGFLVGHGDPLDVAGRIKSRREIVRSEIVAAMYEWHSLLAPPIGVVLDENQKSGMLLYVSPESPAGREGNLKKGDQIVGIGQGRGEAFTSISGMTVSQIIPLLRGESGTVVRLEVLRNAANESRTLEIHRDTTAAWLWAVIKAADTDPWRQNVRNACDLEDITLRLAELERLIEGVDLSGQPVRFLNQVGAELVKAKGIKLATAFMKNVWQMYPDDIATNISLAICLRRSIPAQIEESLRYYTAAVALWPNGALLRNMRGFVFKELEKYDEAVADFREALRLKPDYAIAHSNLGGVLCQQGKLDDAFNECREAIRLNPDLDGARNNLGTILNNQGKLDEAVNEYREAIRLNPDSADARNNLGIILKDQGKLDEAVNEYREAIRLNPDHYGARNNLGIILKDQGKLDEAVNEYREAIRLKPNLFEAHLNLGTVFSIQGRLHEADSEYREAFQLKPNVPHVRAYLGDNLTKLVKLEQAVSEYREEIRLFPNEPHAINGLAWLFATSANPKWREPAQAVELAMRAVQLAPKNVICLNTLGVAQYRGGNWVAAIEALEMANEISDDHSCINGFFLAMSHWQLDHKVEARVWYDKAIAWMDKKDLKSNELIRFRAEAAELLGVEDGLNPIKESPPTPDAS